MSGPPPPAPRQAFLADLRALVWFRGLARPFFLPALIPLGLAYLLADLRGTAIRAIAILTDVVANACQTPVGSASVCRPLEQVASQTHDVWGRIGTLTGRVASASDVVPGSNRPVAMLVLIGILLAVASLLLLVRDAMRMRIATAFKQRVRSQLLRALAREPADARGARGVGALVDVFRGDVDSVSMIAVFGAVGLLEALLQLGLYSTLLVRSIPEGRGFLLLALFLALTLTGQIVAARLTGRRERQAIGGLYDAQKGALTLTTRFFEVFRELTLFGGDRRTGDATTRHWAEVDRRNLGVRLWTGLGATTPEVLQQLTVPIILLVVALTPGGDVGAVIGATLLFAQMSGPLASVLTFPRALAQVGPSMRALRGAMDVPDAGEPSADASRLISSVELARVRLRDVRIRFPGSTTDQLSGVTLDIPAGARVGVVGASGEGKTTLVRVIAGELRPVSGAVLVDDTDITSWPEAWRRRLVGFAPSPPHFLLDTIRANIEFGRDISPDALNAALNASLAAAVVAAHPLGLETVVTSGELLATGEQRRLALARALCSEQRILALDEPTAQMNPGMIREIAERLMGFLATSRRTCFIITHDPELLSRTDFNVFIAGGTIDDVGPHAELRQRNARYVRVLEPASGVSTPSGAV